MKPMADLDKDFADLLSEELNRVRASIASQTSKIQSIIDKTSNILLESTLESETDQSYASKTTINQSGTNDSEIPSKHNFNRATVKNLIKIVENYKKITNLQKLNQNHLIPVTTKSEEFENFQLYIFNKHEFFKNSVRRLQFLLDKSERMKDELLVLSENDSSSDDDDENESP